MVNINEDELQRMRRPLRLKEKLNIKPMRHHHPGVRINITTIREVDLFREAVMQVRNSRKKVVEFLLTHNLSVALHYTPLSLPGCRTKPYPVLSPIS
jgi:hypothetical protein